MDIIENEQKQRKRLKPLQKAVLNFVAITDNPTATKIANNFGVSLRTARRLIAQLKTNGYLARRGNNRSGEYLILQEDLIHGE